MYLVLPHSRGGFQQDFSCPAVLKTDYHMHDLIFRLQDYHPLWCFFPETLTIYVAHVAFHQKYT